MNVDRKIRQASAEELAALYEKHGPGLSDAELGRREEPLGSLETAPEAFQFRDQAHRPWAKKHHIRKLLRAFQKQDGYFDPILLFAVAGHRLVLDGHCRLQAYRAAELGPSTEVPVRYFRGSFSEALTCPASENSKDKLPLTHEEKLEAAWRLVLFDEKRGNYSLRHIEKVTGASKSTAGNMRQVLEREEEFDFKPRQRTWKEVKRERREERDVDPDWKEKRAKAWAHRIRKQLGDKPNDTPQCLFDALRIAYDQIFPQQIPRRMLEESGVLAEILEEREEHDYYKFF